MSLITSSSFTMDSVSQIEVPQLNSDTPKIFNFCSRVNCRVTSNNFCAVGFRSVIRTDCRFSEKSSPRKITACIDEVMNILQMRECLLRISLWCSCGRGGVCTLTTVWLRAHTLTAPAAWLRHCKCTMRMRKWYGFSFTLPRNEVNCSSSWAKRHACD